MAVIWEVKPVSCPHYSCHQAILASYASYRGTGYEMMFAESWGFHYQQGDRPLGSSLNPGYQNRREELIRTFHGVTCQSYAYSDYGDLRRTAGQLLASGCVVVPCDVYNCEWNVSYQKNHIGHHILLIGEAEKSGRFICLDPYSDVLRHEVELGRLCGEAGFLQLLSLDTVHAQTMDYIGELRSAVSFLEKSNFFELLNAFRSDLRQADIPCFEYGQRKDVYAVDALINIRRVAHQRYCYAQFLRYFSRVTGIQTTGLATLFCEIGEQFLALNNMLIHQYIRRTVKADANDRIVDKVIQLELQAYSQMKALLTTV